MPKITTFAIITLFMAVLASALGACSKCDVPDLVPKFCRTSPPAH